MGRSAAGTVPGTLLREDETGSSSGGEGRSGAHRDAAGRGVSSQRTGCTERLLLPSRGQDWRRGGEVLSTGEEERRRTTVGEDGRTEYEDRRTEGEDLRKEGEDRRTEREDRRTGSEDLRTTGDGEDRRNQRRMMDVGEDPELEKLLEESQISRGLCAR